MSHLAHGSSVGYLKPAVDRFGSVRQEGELTIVVERKTLDPLVSHRFLHRLFRFIDAGKVSSVELSCKGCATAPRAPSRIMARISPRPWSELLHTSSARHANARRMGCG